MKLNIITHPLVEHKLNLLRDIRINTRTFRQVMKELSSFLIYEATKNLLLKEVEIQTWQGPLKVKKLDGDKITIVPILRAGLGMLEGVLESLPSTSVSVMGLERDEKTLKARTYYAKTVKNIMNRKVFIIDPMLATGDSMISAINFLKDQGCHDITAIVLVAAPEGVEALSKSHPEVNIITASLDSHLNKSGYIIPGLGDAGDRIFGTV